MRNFSKAFFVSVAFLLCVVLLSYVLIEPFYEVRPNYYQDQHARETVSGTVDFAVLGASFAYRSIDPKVIDPILGTHSYNYSGASMTMAGRYELFTQELARNPIQTVLIDLGSDMIYRDRDTVQDPEGDLYLLDRLGSWRDRLGYIARHIRPDELFSTYSHLLTEGVKTLKSHKVSQYSDEYRLECRGYYPKLTNDMRMSDAEARAIRDTGSIRAEVGETPSAENLEYLAKIVELCKEKGIEVLLFTAPVSLRYICEYSDLDEPREIYENAAKELGVPYIDFNLLRDRNELFSEETDFYDRCHMSLNGAPLFSEYLANFILQLRAGEVTDDMFYASYAAVKAANGF